MVCGDKISIISKMNIEDLTKKIKNVHDGVIGYNDLWWKLCEVNLPQKDKIIASRLIAEASLEYQIKRLIKEWDKKKKINVRFNINGDVKLLADGFCNFQRLIKSALAQSFMMQWHWN